MVLEYAVVFLVVFMSALYLLRRLYKATFFKKNLCSCKGCNNCSEKASCRN